MPYLEHFFILCLAIAVVSGMLKHDRPLDIVVESAKLFVLLIAGVLIFCVFIYILPQPTLLTGS